MPTTNALDTDQALTGALNAIQTLADAAGLTLDQVAEALRSGVLAPGLTFREALDQAVDLMTPGTRDALDPYIRVVRDGMPGACACRCAACLDVVERHRAAADGSGEREPVPCPCVEADVCDCATADQLIPGKTCLDPFPVLADLPVADQGTHAAVVRERVRVRAQRRQLRRNGRRTQLERPSAVPAASTPSSSSTTCSPRSTGPLVCASRLVRP